VRARTEEEEEDDQRLVDATRLVQRRDQKLVIAWEMAAPPVKELVRVRLFLDVTRMDSVVSPCYLVVPRPIKCRMESVVVLEQAAEGRQEVMEAEAVDADVVVVVVVGIDLEDWTAPFADLSPVMNEPCAPRPCR
jgi:hypothetical protein